MAGGDWIKIHRAVLDHPVFQDEWLWKLFTWCILKANYRVGTFRGVEVPVGSFVTGKNRGAEELHVTPSKFFRGIHRLTEDPYRCITLTANRDWTMINVCNYKTYQNAIVGGEPQTNRQRTASEPPAKPIEEEQEQQEGKKGGRESVVAEFVAAWNATEGVRHIREIGKRESTLLSRLSSKGWDWKAALGKFPLKCFASDPGGYVPDLEFFLRPGTVTKILEGKYDWIKRGNQQRQLAIGAGQTFDAGAGASDPNFGRMG
jgi:hypothetical protein